MRTLPLWPPLADHPNASGVHAVLSRLPELTSGELTDLAAHFGDGLPAGRARARALSADLPWVLDTLRCFDVCERLYAGELAELDPVVLAQALRAARDAIAAQLAAPALRRSEVLSLMRPWRAVVSLRPAVRTPDHALGLLGTLADRCHDELAALRWNQLALAALARSSDSHRAAVASAQQLAVGAGRERAWAAVRRYATEAASRRCTRCGTRPDLAALRVLAIAVDAACALLVSDLLPASQWRALAGPLADWVV